jgi:hypothetical protein
MALHKKSTWIKTKTSKVLFSIFIYLSNKTVSSIVLLLKYALRFVLRKCHISWFVLSTSASNKTIMLSFSFFFFFFFLDGDQSCGIPTP